MVENLVNRGIVVAVIGYNLAPKISLQEMIQEISDAIIFLEKFATEGNFGEICLAGHSAGAHLIFMALLNIKQEKLKYFRKMVLLSGIHNLEDMTLLKENEKLKYK